MNALFRLLKNPRTQLVLFVVNESVYCEAVFSHNWLAAAVSGLAVVWGACLIIGGFAREAA